MLLGQSVLTAASPQLYDVAPWYCPLPSQIPDLAILSWSVNRLTLHYTVSSPRAQALPLAQWCSPGIEILYKHKWKESMHD